jgi:predicted esterase YcpF (UPF0227 family)
MLSCGAPEVSMLIYLHGLNSSGQSYKGGVLRERLAPIAVLSPSYPAHRPHTAVAVLTGVFRELVGKRPPLVVGSSMGGFYGQYLARQFAFAHLFLINPALTPWDLLREYEGTTQSTARGKTYRIDRAMIESTRKYEVADPCDGVPTTLFMDRGDDHGFQHLDAAIAVIQEEIARCEHRVPQSQKPPSVEGEGQSQ